MSSEKALLYEDFIDREVVAKYHGDARIVGVCRAIDGYLNLVLENAVFYETDTSGSIHISSCFVRGNAIKHIEIGSH